MKRKEGGKEKEECASADLPLSAYLLPYFAYLVHPFWQPTVHDQLSEIFYYYRWLREHLTSGRRKPPPLITSGRPFESNWTPQTFRDLCLFGYESSDGALKGAHVTYIWSFGRFLIDSNMIWCIYFGHVYFSYIFGTFEVCKICTRMSFVSFMYKEVSLDIHFLCFLYKSMS